MSEPVDLGTVHAGTVDRSSVAVAAGAGTVADLLVQAPDGSRAQSRLRPIPTGFQPLDTALGGGVRVADLVLLGGRPGIGKTVTALQWARAIARAGADVTFVCYEHGPEALVDRLLLAELRDSLHDAVTDELEALRLRTVVREVVAGVRRIVDVAAQEPNVERAYTSLLGYAHRLRLVRGSPDTSVDELDALVGSAAAFPAVLFVDYLQKIAVRPPASDESERVGRVVAGLKDVAVSRDALVVATVAGDRTGLTARRLRMHHLRGSSALAHEADVVIVLNEKWTAVSKAHLAYDAVRASRFQDYVVFSVEKNRDGPPGADVEHRKDFAWQRFDPVGRFVGEHLVDDLLYEE